jgi:predicted kinase
MKKVTFTIGVSASGKSTFAKKQAATVIERDEIREFLFPGYWKQAPDSKKENIVTQEQKRQILGAIKAGKEHIIISDTNLNQKYVDRLLSLFEPHASYEVAYEYFDDSLDYELCLQRNATRERKVPEDVLIKQWKRYQVLRNQYNNYRFDTKEKSIAVVSDLHGQWEKFNQILQDLYPSHRIVSLGDINDCRVSTYADPTISSYNLLNFFYLGKKDTHLIHSNHQKNLIRAVRGLREKMSCGLLDTVEELKTLGLLAFELKKDEIEGVKYLDKSSVRCSELLKSQINFLDTRPTCLSFTHNDKDWRVAHGAVTYNQVEFNPFPLKDELYIYGFGQSGERQSWWLDFEKQKSPKFSVIVGHHHELFFGKNSVVLDPPEEECIAVAIFQEGAEVEFRYY